MLLYTAQETEAATKEQKTKEEQVLPLHMYKLSCETMMSLTGVGSIVHHRTVYAVPFVKAYPGML